MTRNFIVPLLLLFILVGCEKDLPLEKEEIQVENLQAEVDRHASSQTRYEAFAFVGNHPRFQRETQRTPIRVFAVIPEGARDIRYYETDSLRHRDSLRSFARRRLDLERLGDGLLVRGMLEDIRNDRFARISYQLGDSLFVSPAITVRAASLTTGSIVDVVSETNREGYYQFSWRSVPGTEHYFLVLRDRSGDVLIGLTTERTSFQFYDLRSVQHNFFPDLRDPSLVEGATYTMSMYALTSRGWMTACGEHTFTYEP